MGAVGLQPGLRARCGRRHRKPRMVRFARRGGRAPSHVWLDHSAPSVHAFPTDVRSDYPCTRHGSLCRTDALQRPVGVHRFVVDVYLLPVGPLDLGRWVLAKMGALDFAGGAVVHMSSGWAALACALVLGKRKGYGTAYLAPHNLPMTLLGAGLLWFGWFGFNAGSALGANALAASAFLATNTAAARGALSWMATEWLHRGKPTTLGVA